MLSALAGNPARSSPGVHLLERHRPEQTLFYQLLALTESTARATRTHHPGSTRIGHFLERQGLLARDTENSYLSSEAVDTVRRGIGFSGKRSYYSCAPDSTCRCRTVFRTPCSTSPICSRPMVSVCSPATGELAKDVRARLEWVRDKPLKP